MLRKALATCVLATAAISIACTQTSTTTFGYSSWFREGAPGERGAFESQRSQCLEQAGIADPNGVVPGSPEENRFLSCMNDAEWCTSEYSCRKPGV